jgi:hypothetical protein
MQWLLLLPLSLFAATPGIYDQVSDPIHPKRRDWVKIQEFLSHGKRDELRKLEEAVDPGANLYDYRNRVRRLRLISDHFWEAPQFKIEAIGCSEEERDICVITYASYNKRYPQAVQLLGQQLKEIGFKGHFLYRIGGWPDLEGGSLKLAHVPYAFKPCLFQEAKRLGYKKVLWLDASIRPIISLQKAFETIEKQGYLFYGSGHTITPYSTREAIEWFGLTVEEARKIPSLAAGIVGFNLTHPKGSQALDRWMEAARAEIPFLTSRCDQNSLSMIAHLLDMTEWEPPATLTHQKEAISDKTRFFIDYESVQ